MYYPLQFQVADMLKALSISRGVSNLGLTCIFLIPGLFALFASQFVHYALSPLFPIRDILIAGVLSTLFPTATESWILRLTSDVNWVSIAFELWVSCKLIQILDVFVNGTEKIKPLPMVEEWMVFKLIGRNPADVHFIFRKSLII